MEVVEETLFGEKILLKKEIVEFPLSEGKGSLVAVRKEPVQGRIKAQILFLHGFGQNRYSFHLPGHSMTTWFTARGYLTWNLDLRGHGRSFGRSPLPRHIDDYAQDYTEVIAQIAHSAPYPLFALGHSLGGGIIVAGMRRSRPYLRGAILMAGVYGFGGRQPLFRIAGDLLNRTNLLPLTTPLPLSAIGDLLGEFPRVFSLPLMRWSPIQLWYPGNMPEHLIPFRLKKGFDRTTYGVLKHLTRWARDQEMSSWDRRVHYYEEWRRSSTLPLLVLAGNRDYLLPPSDAKKAYSDSPSLDKTFHVFSEREGGAPWGHVDLVQGKRAPQYVWSFIESWLRDHL